MNKTKWITWALFYIYVIMITFSDCSRTLNHNTIERYQETLESGFAIAALIAGTVFSVFWSIGYSFAMFTILDRLQIWANKYLKLGTNRWFSLFS